MSFGPGCVGFICTMTACKRYFSRAATYLHDQLMPTPCDKLEEGMEGLMPTVLINTYIDRLSKGYEFYI